MAEFWGVARAFAGGIGTPSMLALSNLRPAFSRISRAARVTHLRGDEKVVTSRVNSKDDIYDSLKTFFAKGH